MGDYQGKPLLGVEVLAACYLMFGTVTGILMALFLDTAGEVLGIMQRNTLVNLATLLGWREKIGKHKKASVTGDTVGDPFKDTAGPSLHVVIKLLVSTTILVAVPIFIMR